MLPLEHSYFHALTTDEHGIEQIVYFNKVQENEPFMKQYYAARGYERDPRDVEDHNAFAQDDELYPHFDAPEELDQAVVEQVEEEKTEDLMGPQPSSLVDEQMSEYTEVTHVAPLPFHAPR
jgi:hypothetical protein